MHSPGRGSPNYDCLLTLPQYYSTAVTRKSTKAVGRTHFTHANFTQDTKNLMPVKRMPRASRKLTNTLTFKSLLINVYLGLFQWYMI